MKRLTAAALVVGILTASCSGHGGNAMLPSMPQSSTPSTLGAHTTRAAATVVAAPAGWAATATQNMALKGASDNGPLGASKTLTVHVTLQLHNVDRLKTAIASRQIVSRAAFMATYAPTSAEASQVISYLKSHGFTNVHAQSNNILVDGTGTTAQINSAFHTQLESYTSGAQALYANAQPAYVPLSLGSIVVAVLGLNNAQIVVAKPKTQAKAKGTPSPAPTAAPTATPTPAPTPTPTPTPVPTADACTEGVNAEGLCPRFYDPASIQLAYDAAGAPTGVNTGVAIFTEGDPSGAISDFRTNEQVYNLRQVPVNVIQVQPAGSDTSGNGEWTLDMTAVQGLAADVNRIDLYNMNSLSDADVVNGYNHWAIDDKDPIGNSSFGGCELFPYQDGAMLAADEVLVEAAAQGQTMFVATGDAGAYCNNVIDGLLGANTNGVPAGLPFQGWPAVSPYVVAVGGTDLFSNADGSYSGETAWESGGGGLSQFEYSPYWESPTQPVGTTAVGYSFRGVPDVAMDAAIETGYLVYTSSQAANGSCTPCINGGTSVASPLAAGAYARMQSAHGNALGFAPVLFYAVYTENPSSSELNAGPPATSLVGGFHDVLSGSNGMYAATPRYDYTTGLGSFDVVKTNAIIGH